MQNDDKKGKNMKRQGNLSKTTEDGSLKKQWQTPEITEEDFRQTEAGTGSVTDAVIYS